MSEITVSRDELYRKLWQMPMKQIIEHYDTDYYNLRKFCDAFRVPTPPSGYWKKVELGKELPAKPQLKPYNYENGELRTGFKRISDQDQLRRERVSKLTTGFKKFQVPERLTRAHPIVSIFINGTYNSQHYNQENRKQYDPPFSPGTNRALRILDTFLKALESKGYSFEEDQNWWVYGKSGSHKIHFRFREQYRQVKVTHPKRTIFRSELERKIYHLTKNRDTSVTLEPKGVVEFTSYGLGNWVDKTRQPLEDQLQQLLINVLLSRDRAEVAAIEAEQKAVERARLEEAREIKRQERARDQASWDKFTSMADAWQSKADLQSFYFALRAMPVDENQVIGRRTIREWKAWLELKIAESDPLKDGAEEVFRRLEAANNLS